MMHNDDIAPSAPGAPARSAGPAGSPWLAWFWVFLCAAAIYATVPFARSFEEIISGRFGREIYTYVVIAIVLLVAVLAIRKLVQFGLRQHLTGLLWLAAIAGAFILYTVLLDTSPIEALHLLEYGLLSFLLFRAFSHHIRDVSVYVAAALTGILFGIVDESIQWATPKRFFGYDDIRLNGAAVILIQLAIAFGFKPASIAWRPSPGGVKIAARIALLVLVALTLTFLNTPSRVNWYAEKIPFLSGLANNRSQMIEYGYYYDDPDGGGFRSRLTSAALQEADRARGSEVAAILDQYRDDDSYKAFLRRYTAVADAFAHEARVHLFRRDRHIQRARDDSYDAAERAEFWSIASSENHILQNHFGQTLAQSSFVLDADTMAEMEAGRLQNFSYVSRVSHKLMTGIAEWQILAIFLGLMVLVFWLERWAARRP